VRLSTKTPFFKEWLLPLGTFLLEGKYAQMRKRRGVDNLEKRDAPSAVQTGNAMTRKKQSVRLSRESRQRLVQST
jgi:hypothetical protein